MKLRLYRNSIRLRLSLGDVAKLQLVGVISAQIDFGPESAMIYRIRLLADISKMRASFSGNRLSVDIPAGLAGKWADSDQVGLQEKQEVAGKEPLEILVEKDFECLESVAAGSGEVFYPNPGKVCSDVEKVR